MLSIGRVSDVAMPTFQQPPIHFIHNGVLHDRPIDDLVFFPSTVQIHAAVASVVQVYVRDLPAEAPLLSILERRSDLEGECSSARANI